MSAALAAALAWYAVGVSVIPIAADGTKRPAVPWQQYQTEAADPNTIEDWFAGPHGTGYGYGIGLVCGAVSGQLEMLELEGRAVAEGVGLELKQAMADAGLGDLWLTITSGYLEETPSGGLHFLYRVGDSNARRNTKLARRPATDAELTEHPGQRVQVLIETRGEGGQVVVAPSNGAVHATGRPWVTLLGSPQTLPTITGEQRDQLFAMAATLDAMPAERATDSPERVAGPSGHITGRRPGDDYNAQTSWDDILTPRGWRRMWSLGHGYGWRRPGKEDRSISATTGTAADGVDRLYVFSTSTGFETETPYSKFGAYTLLEHGGDYAAAAKALAAAGFGEQAQQVRPAVSETGDGRVRLSLVPNPPGQAASGGTGQLSGLSAGSLFVAGTSAPQISATRTTMRHSDDGNASALIALHGDRLRYCIESMRWYLWDTHRWSEQPSGGGHVRELVKDTAHQLPGADKGTNDWRKRSLSAIGTTNTLTQAATDPRVTVHIGELDADPWALNTPAGVADLRTGTLRPPDPDALHTRATRISPDFDAPSPQWNAFLNVTFGDDAELIGYLQRLVGYSATGYIGPHVLPFAYGSGGNGKGVFLETIEKVLGNYATQAPNAFLMARTYAQHETEIARLAGQRMVICSEVNEDDRFDEAKVKQLTGGDTLTARFMRQDHFTFAPTHHLWLMGNNKPAVITGGRSFWRRCRLIPFRHKVAEADRIDDLQGILAAEEGPAILAWIIRGAADFARAKLREPDSVTKATAEYARDQDTVGRFVEEECHQAPHSGGQVRVLVRDLFAAYERWCSEAGEHPVNAKRFAQELMQRFEVSTAKSNGKRFYTDISLLKITDAPDPDESPRGLFGEQR